MTLPVVEPCVLSLSKRFLWISDVMIVDNTVDHCVCQPCRRRGLVREATRLFPWLLTSDSFCLCLLFSMFVSIWVLHLIILHFWSPNTTPASPAIKKEKKDLYSCFFFCCHQKYKTSFQKSNCFFCPCLCAPLLYLRLQRILTFLHQFFFSFFLAEVCFMV